MTLSHIELRIWVIHFYLNRSLSNKLKRSGRSLFLGNIPTRQLWHLQTPEDAQAILDGLHCLFYYFTVVCENNVNSQLFV